MPQQFIEIAEFDVGFSGEDPLMFVGRNGTLRLKMNRWPFFDAIT